MKVLHVMPSIETRYGGPTQALAGYLEASRAAGIVAHVAAPSASTEEMDFIASRLGAERLEAFSSWGSGSSVVSVSLWRWLDAHAGEFDVVHVHGLFNPVSSLSSRIALRNGRTLVLRPFGTMARFTATHRRSRLKAIYMRLLERANLEGAGAIHFTSEAERAEAAWHGIDLSMHGVIVPPPYVGGYRDPNAVRGGKTVLFLGRLHPIKNLELLIDAWPAIRRLVPEARLVIAGEGDRTYAAALEARARNADPERTIEFIGFADAAMKRNLFDRAAAFVLPSIHENFGIAALEAIAHGLPIAVSDGVQLAPFIESRKLGVVFQQHPEALASAVARTISGEVGERVEREGPAAVRQTFAPDIIGRELAAMYELAVRHRSVR